MTKRQPEPYYVRIIDYDPRYYAPGFFWWPYCAQYTHIPWGSDAADGEEADGHGSSGTA